MQSDNAKTYDHQKKLSSGIHFTIDHNGNWYFHGSDNPGIMKREALVKLFSERALKKEGDKFFLKTPVESYEVEVEDVPYIINSYEETNEGISLITNLGQKMLLSEEAKLFLGKPVFSDISLPYIEVKPGFSARLTQSVREDLINKALSQKDIQMKAGETLNLEIKGVKHPLAKWEE